MEPGKRTLLVSLALTLGSCSPWASDRPDTDEAARGANPAAVKCKADGYQVHTLEENGIPRGTLCVNEEQGRQCEAWAYWRGECSMTQGDDDEQRTAPNEPDEREE